MITVFTPTYNRAHLLNRLYQSLCKQSFRDFEWIIVDDGSVDNTETFVNQLINENALTIRYIKQNNSGKHIAINKGVMAAEGDYFFIVDSDDVLPILALEKINDYFEQIKNDSSFCGVCGLKAYSDGSKVAGEESWSVVDCNALEARYLYKIKGDLAEVFKTAILKQYPFPFFENEFFCPEALVWNRMARAGFKMRYFYEKIYICEYLNDGLTANIIKLRMNSPIVSMIYYSEIMLSHCKFALKVKAGINFWRFFMCLKNKSLFNWNKGCFMYFWLFIPGLLMHLNDLRITRK